MKINQFATNEVIFYHAITTGDTISLELTQVTENVPKTVNPIVQTITSTWFKCQFTTVTGSTQENLTGGTIYCRYDGYYDYQLKKNGTAIEESQFFMQGPAPIIIENEAQNTYVVTNPYAGSSGTSGQNATAGSAGSSGSAGTTGSSGLSGSSGSSGSSASSGSSGINGTSGSSASSGSSGTSGQNGSSGSSATAGTSGSSASSGSSATAGSSGLTGADGDGTAYYGQVSKITSGTINIASAGVYQSTGLSGILDSEAYGVALGTTDTFAVKNTTGSAQLFKIYASADIDAGNNKVLGIKLALNGTPIDNTECNAATGSGTSFAKLITNWMIELQPNDEVALYVTNKSNSGNITLLRARLVASTVGKQGSNGTSGSAGTAGSSGLTGSSGSSGSSGINGTSGSSGTSGSVNQQNLFDVTSQQISTNFARGFNFLSLGGGTREANEYYQLSNDSPSTGVLGTGVSTGNAGNILFIPIWLHNIPSFRGIAINCTTAPTVSHVSRMALYTSEHSIDNPKNAFGYTISEAQNGIVFNSISYPTITGTTATSATIMGYTPTYPIPKDLVFYSDVLTIGSSSAGLYKPAIYNSSNVVGTTTPITLPYNGLYFIMIEASNNDTVTQFTTMPNMGFTQAYRSGRVIVDTRNFMRYGIDRALCHSSLGFGATVASMSSYTPPVTLNSTQFLQSFAGSITSNLTNTRTNPPMIWIRI